MSSLVLRYPSVTVSFLPNRRERRLSNVLRLMRTRVSRRHVKQALRNLMRHA